MKIKVKMNFTYQRDFFTRKAAESFMKYLQGQGRKPELWTGRDGFGQDQFTVKWD